MAAVIEMNEVRGVEAKVIHIMVRNDKDVRNLFCIRPTQTLKRVLMRFRHMHYKHNEVVSFFFCGLQLNGTEFAANIRLVDANPVHEIICMNLENYFSRDACVDIADCNISINHVSGYFDLVNMNAAMEAFQGKEAIVGIDQPEGQQQLQPY
jgi:hypothetical protein